MRRSLLVFFAATATIHALVTPVSSAIVGGWKPVPDTPGPQIQDVGKWAVTEHEKTVNDGLRFKSVVSADMQVTSSFTYRLTIIAMKRNGKDGKYMAVIVEGLTEKRSLVSFLYGSQVRQTNG